MNYDWLGDVAAMQTLGPRKRQEDSALHVRLGRGRLIVVADGMGGEPAGDIASMAAVLGFEKGFGTPADEFEPNIVWVRRFTDGLTGALAAMNKAAESGHGQDGMSTTLAAVWVDPDGIRWISVGDSGIWRSPSSGDRPDRLTETHARGFGVQSGLVAGAGRDARTQADLARFCVSQIDIQPGPREVRAGAMVLVASDGLEAIVETWRRRRYGEPPECWEERLWEEVYRHKNPARFLEAVEGVLAEAATDNTTVIAIRTSVDRTDPRFEDYAPVPGAPDREVLGPELPEGLVL